MQFRSDSPLKIAASGMIAMAVAMGIGRFVYTPILPGMMDEIGFSASDAGLIASANYLGYLIGAIVAMGGWAEGRDWPAALLGLAANALLLVFMGLTQNLVLFLVIRFLAGVASAFVMIFLPTIIFTRLAQAGRNDLQAMYFGGVGLGIAASALVTGAALLDHAHWQASWLWSGLISALGFVVVLLITDRGPARTGREEREPALPRNANLYRLILAYGLFGFGYIVTATFLVTIVRQGETGRLFESVVWLATGLAGIPSVWLWSKVARRIGLPATFGVACFVEALGVLASVTLGGYAGPLLAGIFLGGTFIAITAQGIIAGRRLAHRAPRRALALMTVAFGTGQILGPIVAGYVADSTGSFLGGSVAAAVALLLAALLAADLARKRAIA